MMTSMPPKNESLSNKSLPRIRNFSLNTDDLFWRPQSAHDIRASTHPLRLLLYPGNVRTTSRIPDIGVFLHAGG